MEKAETILQGNEPVEMKTQHFLAAAEWPITAVTVYTDRAEIRRHFGLKLESGLNEVLIEGVANAIIGDSIRVDGQGAAIIHEVQFKEERLEDKDKLKNAKIDRLQSELDNLREQKEEPDNMIESIQKQLSALGNIIENFGKKDMTLQFTEASEQSFDEFCEFYERKSRHLKEKIRKYRKESDELAKQIAAVERELQEHWEKWSVKKCIIVTLQSGGAGEHVELALTYQVYQSNWAPSYDVRVRFDGNKEEQMSKIKITYFGIIRQWSGEEWNNVQLMLSTAQPSCDTLPKIGTTYAQFVRPPPAPTTEHRASHFRQGEIFGGPVGVFGGAPAAMESMATMRTKCAMARTERTADFIIKEAEAQEQILSTTFSISHNKTVKDDGSEHKVTIAVLEFDCMPHFDCVPSKNSNVFMAGTMINSSQFPLLAGWASIYLNNCFNQKVRLHSIMTGERFDIPLGLYSALKVTYKPAHKFHHQTGMLNKSSIIGNEQKIMVKNTRRSAAILTFIEPIPKATDEKIKIRLLSPELTVPKLHSIVNGAKTSRSGSTSTTVSNEEIQHLLRPDSLLKPPVFGARLNSDGNLEWTVLLDAEKESEFAIKWEVEYPPNETVEFKEK